jgi:hypothetical protein
MNIALPLLLVGCVGVAGCGSPEATRTRGGGPGADVGNRPRIVEMHEGSQPFWKTPDRIEDVEHPPLEPSQQAYSLSRQ